jgi:ribose 5-phosphate isomerase
MSKITVYPDSESLIGAAADLIVEVGSEAIAARGRFTLALSGGNTPRPVYARLATAEYRDRIDWSRVLIFFGDERCVPPDDPRSNYHMARTALLDRVPLRPGNIYRIRGEEAPEKAAADYADILQRTFGDDTVTGGPPAEGFDLILLGMGDNGHTASLFPGLAAVTETVRWVMALYVEVAGMWRVTMTPVIINAARHVAFLVAGAEKAETLQRVLEGPYQPVVLPSQIIEPVSGELHWLLEESASAALYKQEAAEYAVQFIQSGMTVGFGTGSTALFATRRIGELYRNGRLRDIVAFATSTAVCQELARLGIPMITEDLPHEIDVTIDGADEVDPQLNLIKGGGGALLQEKIVAQASRREIIIVDESKLSPQLGTRWPVPVEVLPHGWRSQARYLSSLGAEPVLRRVPDGSEFRTDQGNMILDCHFGPIDDLEGLARKLASRAGIIEHGLFLNLARDVIVAGPSGIRHLKRKPNG